MRRPNADFYRRRHEALELFRQRWFTRSSWCRRLIGWAYKVGGRTSFNTSVENFRAVGEAAVADRVVTNRAILLMRRVRVVYFRNQWVDYQDPYVERDVNEFLDGNKLL